MTEIQNNISKLNKNNFTLDEYLNLLFPFVDSDHLNLIMYNYIDIKETGYITKN